MIIEVWENCMQDTAQEHDAAVQELRILLQAEQERVLEAGNKIQDLEQARSGLSEILEERERQAKVLQEIKQQADELKADNKVLRLEKDSVQMTNASLQSEVWSIACMPCA